MNTGNPAHPRERSSIRFTISEQHVDRFAALTGDASSLHVSAEFARRTAYRTRVVHGMLPLLFIAAVDGARRQGWRCRPTALSARFVAPVFCGDVLELVLEKSDAGVNDATATFDLRIVRAARGETVTEGSLSLCYERLSLAAVGPPDIASSAPALLDGDIELRALELQDLSRGDRDGFGFSVSDAAVALVREVLSDATARSGAPNSGEPSFDHGSLLAVALLSTLVGMRLPGQHATFIEFSAEARQPILTNARYRLTGTVAHVSRATSVLKTDVEIAADSSDGPSITGRVVAIVNRPPQRSSTSASLPDAIDLGLRNRVVIVTGASRGIGESTAKLFASAGARVIVNYYRGRTDAERVVAEIAAAGGMAVAVGADVRDLEQVEAMVQTAVDRFGGLDVLVNNAVRDFRPVPVADVTWNDVQDELDVTLRGALHCSKAAIPFMVERGGGKIVAISSVAVDAPPRGQLKYVVSKAALEGLVRSLAMELAAQNIQVNAVVPNFVETDLVSHVHETFRKKIAQDVPMGRHATPLDVARTVVFLASSLSSYTTGQRIMVTGGQLPLL